MHTPIVKMICSVWNTYGLRLVQNANSKSTVQYLHLLSCVHTIVPAQAEFGMSIDSNGGMKQHSWLKHYATSWKAVDSFPD
jgi:hypothetical protein